MGTIHIIADPMDHFPSLPDLTPVLATVPVTRWEIIDLFYYLYDQAAGVVNKPGKDTYLPLRFSRNVTSEPILRKLLPHYNGLWYAPDWRAPRAYLNPNLSPRRLFIADLLLINQHTATRESKTSDGSQSTPVSELPVSVYEIMEDAFQRQCQYRALHYSIPLLEHAIAVAKAELDTARAELEQLAQAVRQHSVSRGIIPRQGYKYGEGTWNKKPAILSDPAEFAFASFTEHVSWLRIRLLWLRLWLMVETDEIHNLKTAETMNVQVGNNAYLIKSKTLIAVNEAISHLIVRFGEGHFACLRRKSPNLKKVPVQKLVFGEWYAQTLYYGGMTWQEMCNARRGRSRGKAHTRRQWWRIADNALQHAMDSLPAQTLPDGFEWNDLRTKYF